MIIHVLRDSQSSREEWDATDVELLRDNPEDESVRDAIRRLESGESMIRLGGGAQPEVTLTRTSPLDPKPSAPVDVHWIQEYGLTQKLSQGVRCF